ncbi:MAG: hypothetical protein ACR2PL_11115 [Dehalococcoidia bacterium]
MTLSQLLPALRDLSRADKWRAMQLLVEDLAQEEAGLLTTGAQYPIWSPLDAFDASKVLMGVLNATETTPDAQR